ncbi:MAG TPA: biotin--[acetyl-CoA-carboxylase] ligase [Limnochorda sp.]
MTAGGFQAYAGLGTVPLEAMTVELADLAAGLSTRPGPYRLLAFGRLPSTNDHLCVLSREGAPEGTVVLAEQQTAGRGRRGRRWLSPPGVGLWFSVLLRPGRPARDAPLFALLAAAAVRAAVHEVTGAPALIKWPNDVVVGTAKLAGILAEVEGPVARAACIVGIGVNVNQTVDDFPPELRNTATSARLAAGRAVPREALLRAILEQLGPRYERALEEGFTSLLDEVSRYSATLGRCVQVTEAGSVWEGLAVGMASDGALLVRPHDRTEPVAVYAGDVSIRPASSQAGGVLL